MTKSVSVVIPSYNGKRLLEKNLPLLMKAATAHRAPVEIIIVDDCSCDDSAAFIHENYPQLTLLVNDKNCGFAETINRGIFASENEIILALNNDIEVEGDLFSRTLDWFNDPNVFSVTPNIVNPRKGISEAITKLVPGFCWFQTANLQLDELANLEGEIPIFFGSGGASFYSREKLLRLKGFDPVYKPFYVEDMDLSYRAWKSGWKCLFEPFVTVYHQTSSTILSMHKKRKIKFIGDRNRTLFLWQNITDIPMIIRYFLFLPFSLLYDIVTFRKYKFIGFFWGLGYLKAVFQGRKKRKSMFKLADKDIIRMVSLKK